MSAPAAAAPASSSTSEGWTRDQVVAYLAGVGRRISASTWSAYVARGQAPRPCRHVGRTPLWDPAEVRQWHAAARGQGWRGGTSG